MHNDKTNNNVLQGAGVADNNNAFGAEKSPGVFRNRQNGEKTVPLPVPKTPSELLWFVTYYVHMFHCMKGLNTLGKDVLLAAEDMLTGAQCVIRKAIGEIKRREEGEMQLRFAVRNAFYGVANTHGEGSDTMVAAARHVALSVAKQLNLPDAEKYVSALEQEYKSGIIRRPVTMASTGTETAKYRVTIDGKVASEKCRRNNLELARILYKHGITDGEKSEDCKALGIDITSINNINESLEFRIRKKHLKIERIQ